MPRKNQSKTLLRNLLNLAAAGASVVVITACMCRPDRDSVQSSNTVIEEQPVSSAANQNSTIESNSPLAGQNPNKSIDKKIKKPDDGDFTVEHVPVQNQRYAEI